MTEQRTDDRERGAASTEHVGIVAVVVTMVLVLVAVGATPVGGAIAARLCEALGATCGSTAVSAGGRAPEDYVPPEACVAQGDGGQVRGSVAAAVQVDGGVTWFIEALGDGGYRMTRSSESGVGLEVGIGFDASITSGDDRYGAGLGAGASATKVSEQGDVFYVGSQSEAEELLSATVADTVKDTLVGEDGWRRSVVDWMTQASDAEKVEPDETFTRDGSKVEASLNGTFANVIAVDLGAKVDAGLYEGERTKKDGSMTEFYQASSKGAANAAFGGFGDVDGQQRDDEIYGMDNAKASYDGTVAIEVDRDKNGNPTSMRLRLTGSVYADAVGEGALEDPSYDERTWQLPLETVEQRQIAGRVAAGLGLGIDGVTTELSAIDPGPLNYGQSWSDFQDAAMRDGYAWSQNYLLSSVEQSGMLDAKYVLEAALAAGYTATARRGVAYEYWDGDEYVSRPGCIAPVDGS